MNSLDRSKIRKYSLLLGVGLILILAMAERYQKIEFDSFKAGQGYAFQGDAKGYKNANNVTIDENGKLSLGNAVSAISIPSPVDLLPSQGSSLVLGNSFLVAGYDSAGALTKIYKSTNGTSISLVKTLSATFDAHNGMIGNGKLAIIFSASATNRFAYSTDEGANWTETTQAVFDQYRASNITIGDYIYFVGHVVSGNYGIIRTRNGQTFEIVYQSPSAGLILTYLEESDGIIYFVMGSTVYKLESGKAIKIKKFAGDEDITLYSNGTLFLLSTKGTGSGNPTKIKLYEFDGISFTLTKNFIFPKQIQTVSQGARDINNVYPIMTVQNGTYEGFTIVTFRIDQDGGIHLFQAFNFGNEEVAEGFIFNDRIYYIDGGGSLPQILYANNYALSGYIETSVIDKGEIIPKQIIIRHKPLPANTSFKIYIKKDFAAAWSLLLTSDTDGAVKKKYNFANGYGVCDFVELKVELITTSNTVTPDFVSMTFLFVPVGLEKSV